MAERREIAETNTAADPAAQAFEALRQEIALLRRAVTGLAADQSSIEVPDYCESIWRGSPAWSLPSASGLSRCRKRRRSVTRPATGAVRSKWPAKKPGAKTGNDYAQWRNSAENHRRFDQKLDVRQGGRKTTAMVALDRRWWRSGGNAAVGTLHRASNPRHAVIVVSPLVAESDKNQFRRR